MFARSEGFDTVTSRQTAGRKPLDTAMMSKIKLCCFCLFVLVALKQDRKLVESLSRSCVSIIGPVVESALHLHVAAKNLVHLRAVVFLLE